MSPIAPSRLSDPPGAPDAGQALRRLPRWQRGLLVAAAGVAILAALGTLYHRAYGDRIFPGVRAGRLELGGLTTVEATRRLQEAYPDLGGEVTLRDPADGRTWRRSRAELGLLADPALLAEAAYAVGRQGNPWQRWAAPLAARLVGHDLLPAAAEQAFDAGKARRTLEELAPEVDVAPVEAEVRLVRGQLVERPAVLGHQLDVESTLALLAEHAGQLELEVLDIAILQTAPRTYDLSKVANAYRTILSGPIRLVWGEDQKRIISVAQLRRWVSIEPVAQEERQVPAVVFDLQAMSAWVARLAPQINRDPVDARFQVDASGRVEVLQPGRSGIRLDVTGTVQRLIEAAYDPSRTTSPALKILSPRVPETALPHLSESVYLTQASTSLEGIPDGRLENILLAVDRLHGIALPQGAEFSFNSYLGQVSAEAGYQVTFLDPAAAVDPNRDTGGLGGGIGQVATTLFRAAFWAGLPITERHAPAYRLGWVEPPVGLDATVDGAGRDLRFTNDTPGYLLIQLTIDPRRRALVCALYGQDDGRRVAVVGPVVSQVTPARGTIQRIDERLPAGVRQQVGWAREGAAATVTRVVRRGQETEQDTFESRYQPWADVVLTGPRP